MKHLIPIMVILLMVSTSFVGVGNQVEELMVDNEEIEQPVKTSIGPMDSPWPTLCHDNRHTSRSPYSTSHITDLEKWRFACDGGVDSGIVIDEDGILYFGDKHAHIYALYPDGTKKWGYKTEGQVTSTPALSEDGTLYVTSWDDYLHAINSSTGKRKWRFYTEDNIAASPIIGDDGTIYFGTMSPGHSIFAINPDGTERWRYPVKNVITSTPVIGDDGTIYIGAMDDYFYALNPNGTLKWRFETGHYIKGPASIADDGTIYVGSYDDYLYALYSNGTLRWKIQTGSGAETNPSIADDGTIYVGDDKLYAINPNGTLKWAFNLGYRRYIFKSDPAISADGTIYIGIDLGIPNFPEFGEVIAVNPDGTERWRKTISNDWCESSPSISEDGTVYMGSQWNHGGYIHAFGPVESNSPPETPTIMGEIEGEIKWDYRYYIQSVDPDNNPISFYIDWGDGNEGWELERASGENCSYWHQWETKGNYTIRVKAMDTLGEESDWAYLEVTMPHSYNNLFCWLNSLLDRFPLMQRLFGVIF